jgi:hypothetical protein
MARKSLFVPFAIALALLGPGLLAGEVVPVTRQIEIMPPPSLSPFSVDTYSAATAVDLGAAGFAVGWDRFINPADPESIKGVTEGRQVLRGGRTGGTFYASTGIEVPGWAEDISMAPIGNTGRFVAVWAQGFDFGGDVWFMRFENGYHPVDPEAVRVAERIDGRLDCNPRVAANGDGQFVIVWKRGPRYGWGGEEKNEQMLAQVFGPDGQPLSAEISVTEPVPAPDSWDCRNDDPHRTAVGMDAAGNFVVVLPGGWGQRFSPTGQSLGDRFRIGGLGEFTELAMLPSGEFVVVWKAPAQKGMVLLSRFTPEGRRTGPLVRVASAQPAMAIDDSGRVALFWRTGRKVALQAFNASLARMSPVLFDSPATTSYFAREGVAFAEDGRILTVWMGPRGSKAADSILGRIWRVR